jgi:hypothetical protein
VNAKALSSSAAYRVVRGDAARDKVKVLSVWRECGSDYSREFADGAARYQWFYLQNPAGHAEVFFLEYAATGRTVGVVGLGTREFWRRGVKMRAGVIVDFIVHPEHRVFYPALLLQRAVRESAFESCGLLIGHPDKRSGAVIRRAGYRPLAFRRFARVIGFSRYLARYVPRPVAVVPGRLIAAVDSVVVGARRRFGVQIEWSWAERFDDRYEFLWKQQVASGISMGCRSQNFLEWRFGARPPCKYRILELTRASSQELVGYFVLQIARDTLTVADFLLPPGAAARKAALLAVVAAASQARVTRVTVSVVGDASIRASFAAAGFREREPETMLIAERADSAGDAGHESAPNWYFTFADVDT